jgi:hypothetical protein
VTGSRFRLRRYSNCNLHWYGPRSHLPTARLHDAPLRRSRYRLYVPDEHYIPGSTRYGRDRFGGTYVWMGTDCGWEWLATRPLINRTPLYSLFNALHEHVHTPHDRPARRELIP